MENYFNRSFNYLSLVEKTTKSKSIYNCGVCGFNKEIHDYKVLSGHDKTCGCRNGANNNIVLDISTDGKIRTQTGLILNSNMANGYEGISVGEIKDYVHRVVASKFIPNPNNYTDVNHIDGNKKNNNVNNLEWCDRSYNLNHAISTGLKVYKKGLKNKQRRFSDVEIDYIRNSNKGSTTIGRELGVSKTTIQNIRRGLIYKV